MLDKNKLEKNINKIYLLSGFRMFMVLLPVIVPFFKSRGLDMENIYQLQSIFAFFVLILELPSGYISDLFGRKNTLLVSSFLWSFGYLIFVFSSDFYDLVFAEIILAASISMLSGTDLSLLYDSLNLLEKKKAPIKVVGRKVFYQQLGEALAGLVGGWLILYHTEAPVVAQAVFSVVPFFITLSLYEPPRTKMSKTEHKENFFYVYRSLFRHSKLLNLIIAFGAFYGFSTLLAVWAFQDYWEKIDIPIMYFGYLWFLTNIIVGIVAKYAHKIEIELGSEKVLIIIGLIPIVAFLGMSLSKTALSGVLFCCLFQVCRGLNSVVIKDALNKRVSADMRATANSILSLAVRLLMIIVGPLMGYLIDFKGSGFTFSFFSGFYVIIFLIVLIPLLNLRNSFADLPPKN